MAGHIYRDGSAGLLLRVQELFHDVQEREARLGSELLAAVPDALARQLVEKASAVAPPAVTPEELMQRERTLLGYRDLLDAAIREASARVQAGRRPRGAPELDWASLGGLPFLDLSELQPHADDLQRSFERSLSAFGAVTFGMEDGACRSRFTWRGSPVSALAAYAKTMEGVLVTRIAFATALFENHPELQVRRRTPVDAHSSPEAKERPSQPTTRRFDTLFVVEGDDAAHAFVTPDVRKGLESIAQRDVPTLWIEGGEVRITWNWDPDAAMFDAAVKVLHAVRTAGVPRKGR
jgi:hypothetical protein